MGIVENIGFNDWPRQGNLLGKRVQVCFQYDADNCLGAECVRDDVQKPFRTIFKLDDGRYLLSTECQFTHFSH